MFKLFSIFKKTKCKNSLTGQKGEDFACKFLKKNGYKILKRNYKSSFDKRYEIDIICKKENVLSFVEVKTRNSKNFDNAYASGVNLNKRKSVRKAIKDYITQNNLQNASWHYDIIVVLIDKNKCHHYECVKL